MNITSKQKKITAASTAAALLLAGGVVLYETYDGSQSSGVSPIDWSLYDLNVPTIEVPTINVPTVDVPSIATVVINLDTPNVAATTTQTGLNIPTTGGNTSVTLPIVSTNTSVDNTIAATNNIINNSSTVSMPVINTTTSVDNTIANTSGSITRASTVTMPVINTKTTVDVTIANTSGYVINSTTLSELNKSVGSINSILIKSTPDDPSKDLPEWIAFVEEARKLFVDKRSIERDKTFSKTNPIIQQWMDIYKQYQNMEPVKYVTINKPFRMITEVRIPKTSAELRTLDQNLEYYKSEGYDSVLVAFTKDDYVSDVLNTIKYIRSYHKIKVWLTYTGKESLTETVFMDVSKYTEILSTCAPYVHGYINSWRKTSAHLLEQDIPFMNYTNHVLREANPAIPIIGEIYYGNTHKYDSVGNVGFGMNNFKNSSGIMIVNFGFKRIDLDYLFDKVLKPYLGNAPTIGCVVGHKPYYMTVHDNGLDYKENMKIKHEVEDAFFKKGCIGTVTLSNDGREMETNNLCTTLYSSLQGNVKK